MAPRDLDREQIDALADTRHPRTGLLYPVVGMQPWYDWLVSALHTLAESSLGDLRVVADDSADTAVHVMPGRASIGGIALEYPGGVIDLAIHNNDTALLWLQDQAGVAAIGYASESAGWPVTPHIRLARATLTAGRIVQLHDLRALTLLSV